MSEWTQGAQEYLDGYLRQVGALARENGDDAREIVDQLRDHVNHEVAALDAPLVTVDMVRRVLAALGTPETVVSGDWSATRNPETPRRAASAPPPPAAPQTVVIQERKGCSRGCLMLAVIGVLLFFGLPVLLALWAIAAPAVSRSREAARRASCQGNLKLIGSVLAQYQVKHGTLPPLSSIPGDLMFDMAAMESDRSALTQALRCPSRRDAQPGEWPGDDQYLYLPMITLPGMLSQFASGYAEAIKKGNPLPVDAFMPGPEIPEEARKSASAMPLIIERPGAHVPSGCNVLYFDGHVEFIRMGQELPVMPEVFNALAQIDMLDGDASLDSTGGTTEWAPVQR